MKAWPVVSLFLLMACTPKSKGAGYSLTQMANPNPFRTPGCTLTVDAVAFDKLIYAGQPEAQRLANMAPEQQATYQDDKKAFSFAFKQQLVTAKPNLIIDGPPAGGNAFLLRPSLLRYSPGSEGELVVDVTDPSGQLLDEFHVTAVLPSLRDAAGPLGRPVDKYLQTRFKCSH